MPPAAAIVFKCNILLHRYGQIARVCRLPQTVLQGGGPVKRIHLCKLSNYPMIPGVEQREADAQKRHIRLAYPIKMALRMTALSITLWHGPQRRPAARAHIVWERWEDMIRIMAFLSRKPGLSTEEFRDYYENRHVPLIMKLNPLKSYRRHYVESEPQMRNFEKIDCDVITEMVFEDQAEADAWFEAFASEQVSGPISQDEDAFLDTSSLRVFKTATVTTSEL